MKKIILVCLLISSGLGCSEKLVYKPAPTQVISLAQATQLAGTVHPWGVSFTAVAQRQNADVRLVVLSTLGVKLLDVLVGPKTAEVYFKHAQFPPAAVRAFIRLARQELRGACPGPVILYHDKPTRADFELHVQGEEICR